MIASKSSITDIINGTKAIEIPFFQRNYVWDEEQWQRMVEDFKEISTLKKEYFLGSVILKQKLTSVGDPFGDTRELIDGQQRLTTISIILKVISYFNTENTKKFEKSFYLFDNSVVLKLSRLDYEVYEKIMSLTSAVEINNDNYKENGFIESDLEHNIVRAYNFFVNNDDVKEIIYDDIMRYVAIVGIELKPDENEQQIFDTINSLGVKLTTSELLKNYMFDRHQLDMFEKYWIEIFEKDETTIDYWDNDVKIGKSDRKLIDLFFYYYLLINQNIKSSKNVDKTDFLKFDKLFDNYKEYIKDNYSHNMHVLFEDIKKYAIIFQNTFNPNSPNEILEPNDRLQRINTIIFGLDTTTIIAYVLFLEANNDNSDEKNKIYDVLEAYIMRRMVLPISSKNYNKLFSEQFIYNNIITYEDITKYLDSQSNNNNFFPTDEQIEKNIYLKYPYSKQARGILYLLESKVRSSKQSTGLLSLTSYSIEHVMPKNWRANWKISNSPKKIEERNSLVKTLGNLTIITHSLNSSIKDADWKTKLVGRKGKNDGLKQYASGLELFSKYLYLDNWDNDTIKNRNEELANIINSNWNYNR